MWITSGWNRLLPSFAVPVFAAAGIHAAAPSFSGDGEFEEIKRLTFQGDAEALALRIRDGFDPKTRFEKAFYQIHKSGRTTLAEPGANLLHLATHSRSERTIRLLLGLGVDPNTTDRSGSTPLHYAVRTRSTANVVLLLEGGADSSALNHAGESSLYLAIQTSNSDAVREMVTKLVTDGFGDRGPATANDRKSLLSAAISKPDLWALLSPHFDRLPIAPVDFKTALETFAARGE